MREVRSRSLKRKHIIMMILLLLIIIHMQTQNTTTTTTTNNKTNKELEEVVARHDGCVHVADHAHGLAQ